MKKVLFTIIVTMLIMLVIGNGLGLVYLSYKCDKADKELNNLKLALASKGVVNIDEIATNGEIAKVNESVTIKDEEVPESKAVEKLEDNEEYQKYIKLGVENIDEIVDELPNYYAAMALEEILGISFKEVAGIDFAEDSELANKESKEVWEEIIEELPKNIFDIVNSSDDIEDKIKKLEAYGTLAYPVVKNINDSYANDEEIEYDNCKLSDEISIKEIKELRQYEEDMDLDEDEKEALEKIVTD